MTRLTVAGHTVVVTPCDGNETRMWRVTADNQPVGVILDNIGDWQPAPLYQYGPAPVIHCPTQRQALEALLAETLDHRR